MKRLTTKQANELRLAYLDRDVAVRLFEAAKKSTVRGLARRPYEELVACEKRIDSIRY